MRHLAHLKKTRQEEIEDLLESETHEKQRFLRKIEGITRDRVVNEAVTYKTMIQLWKSDSWEAWDTYIKW